MSSENASSSKPVKPTTRSNRKRTAFSEIQNIKQDPVSSSAPPRKLAQGELSDFEAKELGFKKTDNVFVVEDILDTRVRKRKIECLLKWEGYGDEDNSWEPLGNLTPELKAEAKMMAAQKKRKRGKK